MTYVATIGRAAYGTERRKVKVEGASAPEAVLNLSCNPGWYLLSIDLDD